MSFYFISLDCLQKVIIFKNIFKDSHTREIPTYTNLAYSPQTTTNLHSTRITMSNILRNIFFPQTLLAIYTFILGSCLVFPLTSFFTLWYTTVTTLRS